MWVEDPNKVGNLIKGEKKTYSNLEKIREDLIVLKKENKFKKYKLKIPFKLKSP